MTDWKNTAEIFKRSIINNDYDTLDTLFEERKMRYILFMGFVELESLVPNTPKMLNYLIKNNIEKKYLNIPLIFKQCNECLPFLIGLNFKEAVEDSDFNKVETILSSDVDFNINYHSLIPYKYDMLMLLLDHEMDMEYLNTEQMVRFCEYECLDVLLKLGIEFNTEHLNNSIINNDYRVFFVISKYVRPPRSHSDDPR